MSITTTNTHVPGRLPQRSAQQPLVWDAKEQARTIHPNRETPRLKIKETPKFTEKNPPRKHMPRQKETSGERKTHLARELASYRGQKKHEVQQQKSMKGGVTKKPPRPGNKAAPKLERVKQTARRMDQIKKSEHPFLTKDSRSSKPQGSEQLRCGGPKQTPSDTKGRPRNC